MAFVSTGPLPLNNNIRNAHALKVSPLNPLRPKTNSSHLPHTAIRTTPQARWSYRSGPCGPCGSRWDEDSPFSREIQRAWAASRYRYPRYRYRWVRYDGRRGDSTQAEDRCSERSRGSERRGASTQSEDRWRERSRGSEKTWDERKKSPSSRTSDERTETPEKKETVDYRADDGPVWEKVKGCDVVTWQVSPDKPSALVYFIGGLGAGGAPRALYKQFLEQIARRGQVAVVTAAVPSTGDHDAAAAKISLRCAEAMRELAERWGQADMPVFGMGHSLGAKLLVLGACDEDVRRAVGPVAGNVLLAYNGMSAREAMPMLEWVPTGAAEQIWRMGELMKELNLDDLMGRDGRGTSSQEMSDFVRSMGAMASFVADGSLGEMSRPGRRATMRMMRDLYDVADNLVVSFKRDTMDGSEELVDALKEKFEGQGCVVRELEGSHITPVTPVFDETDFDGEVWTWRSRRAWRERYGERGNEVSEEVDKLVAVVVAFLKLRMEQIDSGHNGEGI